MLIYRDAPGMPVSGEAFWNTLLSRAVRLACETTVSYDVTLSLAIDLGMFEAAVADAREADSHREPITIALRAASVEVARAALAAREGRRETVRRAAKRAADALQDIEGVVIPPALNLRIPEGFAYYGLFPDLYADAVLQLQHEVRGAHTLCLGIRSIGTTLSAFVAAALENLGSTVTTWTIRPKGHPFDRRAQLGPDLARELLNPVPALVLIVDEGPGLSGSSFAAAVDALRRSGVPMHVIVLLPAWSPDPARFVSSRAARTWAASRKVLASFEEQWLDSGRLSGVLRARFLQDLSAGKWTAVWPTGGKTPAIQPQHERRKYLVSRDAVHGDSKQFAKFAGLGRFGENLLARAHALDGLPVTSAGRNARLEGGFLVTDVIAGTPMSTTAWDRSFIETVANYLTALAVRFGSGVDADRDPLACMLEVNAHELLPEATLSRLGPIIREARTLAPAPAVRLDGRMLPHEWLRTAVGPVKADALEHHDDHFFPGPQDVAWDVAATIEEFDLGDQATTHLAEVIGAALGDPTLADRLEFYRSAYLAFRAAYCLTGADALGASRESKRLRRAGEEYRRRLGALLQ